VEVGIGLGESTQNGENQRLITDWLADVGKRIIKSFKLGAICTVGHVALWGIAKLRLKLDCAVLMHVKCIHELYSLLDHIPCYLIVLYGHGLVCH
jgi:hypothetical protein